MAEKPSGITAGDGTQGSPYEVHSYDEIYWCCTDTAARPTGWATGTPVYLKLVNNIDCQDYDVDFTWNISVAHGIDFDLATHTIKTFYIAADGHLFHTNVSNSIIFVHDGKILNVYAQWETGSRAVLRSNTATGYIQTKNISFSIDVDKFTKGVIEVSGNNTTNHKIVNCSFYLQNIHPIGSGSRSCMTSGGAVTYSCCDFYMVQKPDSPFTGSSSSSGNTNAFDATGSIYTNCRFKGVVNCVTSTYSNFLFAHVLRNCVYAATTNITKGTTGTATGIGYNITANNSTSTYGIYNEELIHLDEGITNFKFDPGERYAACTTFEMDRGENPNAAEVLVNEKHFDVIVG